MAQWYELRPDIELPERAARLERSLPAPISREDLLGLLVTDPELGIRVEQEVPDEQSDGPLQQMVGRTRLFVERKRLTDFTWDAGTFVGVMALAQSPTFSMAATLFQRAIRTVKILSDAELDMIIVLTAVSHGDPYGTVVAMDDIVEQYDGDTRRALDRLSTLLKKGVVEKVGTGWRVVW
ncbi:hypothetical protein [Nocardia yunnanensis]|uniref:hypothetical protein n=1 Tax=Nocardia yunnanensis TaxID=2382165 RepID=UPI0013C49A92|nr:hypothetical protein [Nocardia yunnanensis]